MRPGFLVGVIVCAWSIGAQCADKPAGGVAAAPPTAPPPEWMTRLFDGKSLDGWVQVPENSWTVKDGVIASLGAGRGVIYTTGQYERYRIIFDVRHVSGQPDHRAGVLVFCTMPKGGEKPMDALGGIQFQVPNGGSWDYRKGKNNNGKGLFTRLVNPKFDEHQWSRVEILVDARSGTARMAVAQPVGAKAVEVLVFKDPTAGQKGPFALQMHNKGLFDEFANIAIEVDPKVDRLITVGE
jgi:Domain of Unknown Function (DUF1080)